MSNLVYPWLEGAWHQLQQARDRLPHALLLHGPAGIGKTAFAEALAQSLLCLTPKADGRACGACQSCAWVAEYSHMDYRRIRPTVMDAEDALDNAEAAEGEEEGSAESGGKKAKKLSKDIVVDQIRDLARFMNVSTHRGGLRVVVMYPAETINSIASNALLKTLEEPAPGTVMILVTDNLDSLMPTILSRCRKLPLPMPDPVTALAWLKEKGVKDAERWLAEQGGAPLAALAASQSEDGEVADEFLAQLARPGVELAMKTAERLSKTAVLPLVTMLQRWLHDLVSQQMAGRIRYYPRYRKELAALAGRVPTGDLLAFVKATNERRAIAEHPLAARLFIEDMLLQYVALFR